MEIIEIAGIRSQGSLEVEVLAIWRLLEVQDKVIWIQWKWRKGSFT